MKRSAWIVCAMSGALGLASAVSAQEKETVAICVPTDPACSSEPTPVPVNPNQVAILRWYTANQTADFITGPVGNGPFGVAFDGASIWVTNGGTNKVTKVRASDGTLLGAFPVDFVMASTDYGTYAVKGLSQRTPPALRLVMSLPSGAVYAPEQPPQR